MYRLAPRVLLVVCTLALGATCGLWLGSYRSAALTRDSRHVVREKLAGVPTRFQIDQVSLKDAVELIQLFGFIAPEQWGGLRWSREPLSRGPSAEVVLETAPFGHRDLDLDAPVSLDAKSIPIGTLLVELVKGQPAEVSADDRTVRISPLGNPIPIVGAQRKRWLPWLASASKAADAMNSPLSERIEFPAELPWAELFSRLSNATKLPIHVDWNSLASAGIKPTGLATPSPSFSTASDVLRSALEKAAPRGDLQFRAAGDHLEIASRREFDERDLPAGLILGAGCIVAVWFAMVFWLRRRRRRALPSRNLRRGTLLIAAVALAVTCYFLVEPFELTLFSHLFSLSRAQGHIQISIAPADPMTPYYERSFSEVAGQPPMTPATFTWSPGHAFEFNRTGWPIYRELIRVQFWVLAALAGPIPLGWLVLRLSAQRREAALMRAGRCRNCGYDLRASKGSCPECGSPPHDVE